LEQARDTALANGIAASTTIVDAASRPRRRAFWLKLLLTLAILVGILINVDWNDGRERLARADVWLLAAAFATLLLSIVLVSLRWSVIAGLHGMKLLPGTAVRVTLAAQFFGQILPSTLGADAVRSWLATRLGLPVFAVVASVIVDRICGLVGLALLILIGLPRLLALSGVESGMFVAVAALLVMAAAAGATMLLLLLMRIRLHGLAGRIRDTLEVSARAIASTKGMWAVASSIIIQAFVVLSVVLIAWSVDLPLGLADAIATVPAAMLVAVIPITINGWGLREGAMITAMGLVGVSPADALVVSVLFGTALLLAALPGSIAWLSLKGTA
jgi:hypothetical protein